MRSRASSRHVKFDTDRPPARGDDAFRISPLCSSWTHGSPSLSMSVTINTHSGTFPIITRSNRTMVLTTHPLNRLSAVPSGHLFPPRFHRLTQWLTRTLQQIEDCFPSDDVLAVPAPLMHGIIMSISRARNRRLLACTAPLMIALDILRSGQSNDVSPIPGAPRKIAWAIRSSTPPTSSGDTDNLDDAKMVRKDTGGVLKTISSFEAKD